MVVTRAGLAAFQAYVGPAFDRAEILSIPLRSQLPAIAFKTSQIYFSKLYRFTWSKLIFWKYRVETERLLFGRRTFLSLLPAKRCCRSFA
jgi:hypothetical protein